MVLGVATPLVAMNDLPPARFGGYRVGEPSATHQMAGLSMLPRAEGEKRIDQMIARGAHSEPAWLLGRAAAWASFAYAARLLEAQQAWGYMLQAARALQSVYASWDEFAEAYAASRVAFRGKTGEPKGYEKKLFAKLLKDPESPWVRARFDVSLDDVPPPIDVPRTVRVAGSVALHAALAAAQPGDHLVLAAGEYTGPFELDTDVTLTAARAGKAVLSGPVQIDDAGVFLDGLVIRGGGVIARGDAVVHLQRCCIDGGRVGLLASGEDTHVFARDLRVESPDEFGVIVDSGAQADLERVRVSAKGSKHSAISIESKATARLRDCDVRGAGEAGVQVHAATATVTGGQIVGTGMSALLAREKARVHVTGARFERAGQSLVAVRAGSEVNLTDCTLQRAKLAGLDVGESRSRLVARRCRVEDVQGCGVLVAAGNASLQDCVIAGARYDAITVREGGRVSVLGGELSGARGAGVSVETEARANVRNTTIGDVTRGVLVEAGARAGLESVQVAARETSLTVFGTLAMLECTLRGAAHLQLEVHGGRATAVRTRFIEAVDISVATAGDARVSLHECELSGGELAILAEDQSCVRVSHTEFAGCTLAAVSAQPGEVRLDHCVVRSKGNGIESVGGRVVLDDTWVDVPETAVAVEEAGVVEAQGGSFEAGTGWTFDADPGTTLRVTGALTSAGELGLAKGEVIISPAPKRGKQAHAKAPAPPAKLPFRVSVWEDRFTSFLSSPGELLAPCAEAMGKHEDANGHGVAWLVQRIAAAESLEGVSTDPEADSCTILSADYDVLRRVLTSLHLTVRDPARLQALLARAK